jgi:signal transduction histidine kinase
VDLEETVRQEAARADVKPAGGTLQRKVTAAFAGALIVVIALAFVVFDTARRALDSGQLVAHTHEVLQSLNGVEAALATAQAAVRGFGMTGDDLYLRDLSQATSQIELRVKALAELTADSAAQSQRSRALVSLLDERLKMFDRLVTARQTGGLEAARKLLRSLYPPPRTGKVHAMLEEMAHEEQRLLAVRTREQELARTVAVGGGFLLAILFVLLSSVAYLAIRAQLVETVRLNTSLMRRTDELEATNRELEGFSYSVSHDLRAPLRAIDGFSRILVEEHGRDLDEESRHLLGVIRENSNRMGRLIDDLLAFSRLGKQHLSRTMIDMATLAVETFRELREANHEGSPVLDVATLPVGWGDPAMLRQVFANLLSNALKYVRKDRAPHILVTGWPEEDRNVYCVKDNGVGFDMAYYDKLFGVFQRLHSEKEFPGTGVGLAIVQRVVVRHGGRVWAESRLGHGSSFYFALPVPVPGG